MATNHESNTSDTGMSQPSVPHDRFQSLALRGRKILWIVSSGGHLVQALQIERLIGTNPESVWITNDVPQARSLLSGRVAEFVDYVAPRDLRGAVRTAALAFRVARRSQPDQIISTGAAIAGVALPLLALRGYTTTFVESVARRTSRSVTGRIAAIAPMVRTLTQYSDSTSRRWIYDGTILSSWVAGRPRENRQTDSLKVFVTLGTIRPYRFDSAVDAVLAVLNPSDDVVWQLGETTRDDLPGKSFQSISHEEAVHWMAWADVVVTHAGVGSIVDALQMGKFPVVVVREASRKEHVDDHQQDIAREIERRGLGARLSVQSPSRDLLQSASQVSISHRA